MTDKFLVGDSVFKEMDIGITGCPDDWRELWDEHADEPSPKYWNSLAIGIAIGMVVGIVLAWMPAGLIIWRLWR